MRRHAVWLLMLSGILVCGCGPAAPPTGTVSGKVLIDGKPATEQDSVRVYFINSMIGQGSDALVGADGTYTLRDPLRANEEYTVYFGKHLAETSGPVSTAAETLMIVPKEYRNEMSSPLKKKVEEGENVIDLDIPAAQAK